MSAPGRILVRSPRAARLAALAPYAPLLGIAAYAIVIAARIASLVHDTATSDAVGPMVIAQSLPDARPGSTVVMGNAAHYTTLWIDLLTRHLPGHRFLWQAWPYVLALLGLALLVETVRRLAGTRAALLTLAIGIATPPLVLVPLLSQAFHDTTFVNGIVLAAMLAWMGASRSGTPRLLIVSAIVAVVTGLDLASDPLLLVSGVVPFVAAAALHRYHRRDVHARDMLRLVAAMAAAALVVAGATTLLMRHAGYSVEGLPLSLAGVARIRENASLLGHLVLDLGNGRLALHDLGDLGPLRLVCGVLVVVAAVVPFWLLVRIATQRRTRPAEPQPGDADEDDTALRARATELFLAYWGLVALCLTVALLLSTALVDRNSMRYLLPGVYAIAASVPFAAVRSPGRATAAGVALAFTGVVGAVLLLRAGPDDFDVQPQHGDGLIAALRAHHLHRGYAGYWQANLLTWESDGAITSRAVQQGASCHARTPGWFCPYPIFSVSDWYRPQSGPTFLIRELGGSFVPDAPPALLHPISVFSYDRFEVYVFDHDIAADAARNASGWTSHQTATP